MNSFNKKKLIGALVATFILIAAPIVEAQTSPPPPGGTTPPPGGTTPPPGGTTPPPGGTTPPPGGTTPPPGGTTPPPGGTTPPPGGTTPPPGGTTPPPGGTTPPPGGTTPPPGGTTPPPGGTTPPPGGTAPKTCFIPTAGVTAPAGAEICSGVSVPTVGGSSTGTSDFFKNVTTTQLGGLSADQLKKFDPAAASNFTPTQIGALAPDALKGAGADLIKNLAPTAVAGFKDTQLAALPPDAFKSLTPDQIKNLAPTALGGLQPTQMAQMQPSQLSAMQSDQFNKLGANAVGAVTPDQFKSLSNTVVGNMDSSKIAALDPSVIKSLDKDSLAKLNPNEVKKLDGKDLTEMLVNLNKQTVSPTDVKSLLPPGWTVDDKTGKVQAPAGTKLTLPTTTATTPATGVQLPKVPDLSKGLSVGGDATSGSVIEGMKKAMDNAGLTGFNMTQTNGLLKVEGTGAQAGTKLAFIPDGKEVKQAPAGTASGLSQDAAGKYVLTTPDGMQVPIIPALTSPENLQKVSPGAKVEVDVEGGTKITQAGKTPVVGIPDPFVKSSTQPPGIYRQGSGANEQVTVVYDNGTAQTLKPAIQDATEFREATKAFPQIKEVTIGADGVISIDFNGQMLKVRPNFDVEPGTGTTGSAAPTITAINATTFKFTNSKGDSQVVTLGG